jgi:DNA-binding XRE family transcriptional regulator
VKIRELKQFRKSCGYTQEEVGKVLGINKSNYCRREKGQVPFTLKDVMLMQNLFNMTFLQVWNIFLNEEVVSKTTK